MGLLGLLLPSRCAGCEVPGAALCETCRDALVRIAPPVCERCGCPGAWPVRRCVECRGRRLGFARARAAFVYDARARALVSAWKERGRRELAALLAGLVVEVVARPAVAALTFVPGDRERGRERGHVPAARLAAALAELWDVPLPAAPRPHRHRLAEAGGPPPRRPRDERPRRVRGLRHPTADGGDRRRRLHDRRHGGGVRHRASAGRRIPRRGGLPRESGAVAWKRPRTGGTMRLKVTVRHGHVNDGVRSYVESKFAKLGRRLHDETLVEVVLDRERNPKIPDDHLVEAEVHMKGPNLHGREAAATYEAAADLLVDKLERQIERRRDKVVREPRRRAQGAPAEPVPVEMIEESLRATSEI